MDLSQFHFLRPLWLLALLPVALIGWRLLRRQHPLGPWAEVFEARFLALFNPDPTPRSRAPLWALLGLWTLMVLALAGPTLHQQVMPAHKVRSATVIVLDLSLSMLAQDVPPSRIERARYKLHDLIERHPDRRFGMVAYAGSAHVIAPIAEDSATLLNLLPSLNPLIMPKLGSRPDLAMEEAHRLFQGSRIRRGHIIWVTDDLDRADALRRFFKRHDYTLAILAVGTRKGAPIPLPNGNFLKDTQGNTVIARLPWQALKTFAEEVEARLTPLRLDDQDLDWLLPHDQTARSDDSQRKVVQWQDLGPWLTLIVVVLATFGFRRGWLFALVLLSLPMMIPPPLLAAEEKTLSDWRDLFRTPDQQAYRQWQQKHYSRACDLFEQPAWKGAACYRAGRLEEARRAFAQDATARGAYNLGNTLARMGDYQGAIKAWQRALELDPNLQPAKKNLQLLQHWLSQQKSRHSPAPSISQTTSGKQKLAVLPQSDTADSEKRAEKQSKPAQRPKTPAQNATERQNATAPKPRPGKNGGDPTATAPKQGKPEGRHALPTQTRATHPVAGGTQAAPEQQSRPAPDNEQTRWLRLIPDQPGLFLQRKFEYQLQRQGEGRQESKTW